ncbi:hypothetical protein ACERC8_01315 [Streptococcus sp. E29BA]|uniref:hypothetical protein n=1 Tax=Streptococcus sp. E29BA TaxID=3278716 RepID=UPI00359D5318
MRSYDLKGALDFFLYVFDEEDKEALTKIWLAKEVDMTLADFITKYSKKAYIKRLDQRTQSVAKDKRALEQAEAILNMGRGEEVLLDGIV